MISADTISILIDVGLGGETLKKVVAAIERDVTEARNWCVTERNSVTHGVTDDVTPAALRMRRMRERKASENNVLVVEKTASVAVTERNNSASQSVTTYNILTSSKPELVEEKKDSIVRNVTRKRNSYAADFEAFWSAFPTDPGMSKAVAAQAWAKLSAEDREAATACIPAFKAWASAQGENYRMLHACRYLSQRRFEGFKEQAAKTQAVNSTRVYVMTGTDAMDAWDDHFKRTKGKLAPRDQRGGWWFDSEFPPTDMAA